MSKYSPSNYVGKPIICTNPCAEVPLEDGGACNLGSINLSRFVKNGFTAHASIDWDQLADSTMILTRFLDNVVTWNESLNALEKQRLAAKETRRLGLGVMGIADMLNQMGLAYDSKEGIDLIEKSMAFITNAAYQASASLAGEKGPSPIFNYKNYMECPFIKESLSEKTKQVLNYVPSAVFPAIIFPAVFLDLNENLVRLNDPKVLSILVAFISGLITKNLIFTGSEK